MIQNIIKLVVLPLAFAATQVNAATMSYDMTFSNAMPDGADYLTVTISDSTTVSGEIDFSVVVNTLNFPFDSGSPSNFGMDKFFFNYDNSLTVGTANINNIDPNDWNIKINKNAGGGFGFFDFNLNGPGSRTELLSFSIDVAGDSISSYAIGYNGTGDAYFAAHVGGFDDGSGVTSAQFATVVPVPAAALLFGSGLIGLAGIARRRS